MCAMCSLVIFCSIFRLAAAQEAALAGQGTASGGYSGRKGTHRLADRMGHPSSRSDPPAGGGPTSLFILTEENIIRRLAKHLKQKHKMCNEFERLTIFNH